MKKEFYNLKYGKCKLLDEKKDLYLVYAENCELHYIVCTYIDNMGIVIKEPNTVNYPVYFLVCYLLVYSVSILIGIVIDIFNSGQTTLLDDDSNAE